MGVII